MERLKNNFLEPESSSAPPSRPKSKFPVNKSLLSIKIHYFFYFGAMAPVYPYLPVIASHIGFSSLIIGIIYGIMPLAAIVVKPVMGALADRFNAHWTFLLVVICFEALFFFTFQWALPLPVTAPVTVYCDSTERPHMEVCPALDSRFLSQFMKIEGNVSCDVICKEESLKMLIFDTKIAEESNLCFSIPLKSAVGFECAQVNDTCNLESCSKKIVKSLCEKPKVSVEEAVHFGAFWLLLFLIVMVKICLSIDICMADTICFFMLEDKPYNFGYQRLWGSLSYGLTNPIASLLVDAFSDEAETNFRPLFYMSAFLFACCLVNGFFLKWKHEEKSKNIVEALWRKLFDVHVLLFLFTTLIFGAFTQIIWVYILVYIEEVAATSVDFHEDGWIHTLNGLVVMVECLAEIPFFFVSKKIISTIGHELVYTGIMGVWAIRFLIYYLLTNPWMTLPVEILNGVTFGLFYAAMTTYSNAVSPLGAEATVQGTTSAVFEGAGLAIGGFIGGPLTNFLGIRKTFLTLSVFAWVACLGHGLCHFGLNWRAKKKAVRGPAES